MTQPQSSSPLVFVGIGSCVVALDKQRGSIAWSTRLRVTSTLVTLMHDGPHVFAVAGGEISCLAAATGALLWHNPLRGYGRGFAILAGGASDDIASAQAANEASATTAAASNAVILSSAMHHSS